MIQANINNSSGKTRRFATEEAFADFLMDDFAEGLYCHRFLAICCGKNDVTIFGFQESTSKFPDENSLSESIRGYYKGSPIVIKNTLTSFFLKKGFIESDSLCLDPSWLSDDEDLTLLVAPA